MYLEDNTKPMGEGGDDAGHAEDADDGLGAPHQNLLTSCVQREGWQAARFLQQTKDKKQTNLLSNG